MVILGTPMAWSLDQVDNLQRCAVLIDLDIILEYKKLVYLIPRQRMGQLDCAIYRSTCANLAVTKFPTFIAFKVYKYLEMSNKNVVIAILYKELKKLQLYHLRKMMYYVL